MTFYGDTPTPAKFARRLSQDVRGALCTASMTSEGLAVHHELHGTLNPYGLVDARKPLLSAFGISVLRAIQGRSA